MKVQMPKDCWHYQLVHDTAAKLWYVAEIYRDEKGLAWAWTSHEDGGTAHLMSGDGSKGVVNILAMITKDLKHYPSVTTKQLEAQSRRSKRNEETNGSD